MQVLQPFEIRGLRLPNRVVLAAMSRMQANADGTATDAMAGYYARYAKEGIGLLITEAIYTDVSSARAYFNQPGLVTHQQTDSWKPVVDAVHRNGGIVFAQLLHAGRLAAPGLNPVHLGASAGTAPGTTWQRGVPNAMASEATQSQIAEIVEGFARAALNA